MGSSPSSISASFFMRGADGWGCKKWRIERVSRWIMLGVSSILEFKHLNNMPDRPVDKLTLNSRHHKSATETATRVLGYRQKSGPAPNWER